MASLLQLKRRITASQNVAKTTRAMQMIAASKLKRAQDATLFGRPYVEKLTSLSQNLSHKVEEKDLHPYIKRNEKMSEKTLVFILAPDKGLCGGLIANLIRSLLAITFKNKEQLYVTLGKKVEKQVASLGKQIIASFKFGTTLPSFDTVYPLTKIINEYFLSKKVDEVVILHSAFVSVFSQKPELSTILPIQLPPETEAADKITLFEPTADVLLPTLLSHYLEMVVYQHLLESYASEQAARMAAMQTATDNALEIANDLRLAYNKERQERITNEILDIYGTFNLTV